MAELDSTELRLMFAAMGTLDTEATEIDEIIYSMATSLLMTGKTELAKKLLQQHREEQQ